MNKKKKLDHLKQQYEDIQIPKDLKQKVKSSIEAGKSENESRRKKARFTGIAAKLGISAAAALFVITVAANANQNMAYGNGPLYGYDKKRIFKRSAKERRRT